MFFQTITAEGAVIRVNVTVEDGELYKATVADAPMITAYDTTPQRAAQKAMRRAAKSRAMVDQTA